MSLSSLIVQREIATIREVEEALARQVLYGGDLVTNLLEVCRVDESALNALVAESFGMTAAPSGELPPPTEEAKRSLAPQVAAERALAPLSVDRYGLVVAVAEPLAPEAEQELSFALALPISQQIAPLVRVREALARDYGLPLDRRMKRVLSKMKGELPTGNASLRPPPVSRSSTELAALSGPAAPPRPPSLAPPPPAATPSAIPPPLDAAAGPPSSRRSRIPPAPPAPALAYLHEEAAATFVRDIEAPPARPARRRRGPLTSDVAREELEEVEERDAIFDLLFEFAKQYFDYTALFVLKDDLAEGRDAFGSGAARDKVGRIGVPLAQASSLQTARETRALVRTTAKATGADAVLLNDLGRPLHGERVVLPVVVRNRVVALLLGDPGEAGLDEASLADVRGIIGSGAAAFERLIVRRKLKGTLPPPAVELGSRPPGASPASPPAASIPPPTMVSAPEELAPPVREIIAEVARSQAVTASPPIVEVAPTSSKPLTELPPPANLLEVRRPSKRPIPREEPDSGMMRAVSVPATVISGGDGAASSLASAASAPPTSRKTPGGMRRAEAPAFDFSPRPPPSSVEQSFEQDDVERLLLAQIEGRDVVPSTTRDAAPPAMSQPPVTSAPVSPKALSPVPPRPRSTTDLSPGMLPMFPEHTPFAPPVFADADATPAAPEVAPVFEPVKSMPPSEQQISVGAHRPPSSRSDMSRVLPSVIVDVASEYVALVDRVLAGHDDEAESGLLRAGGYAMPAIMARFPGPVTLEQSRPDGALPRVGECGPVLRLVSSQRRTALPFVLALVEGDDADKRFWATYLLTELVYPDAIEPAVKRLFDEEPRVRRVARAAIRALAEAMPSAVVERLEGLAKDAKLSMSRRARAIEALADTREPSAVPVLVRFLHDAPSEVESAARSALAVLTRHDFGTDAEKWHAWWSKNEARHRIEWLIDALAHDDAHVRAAAGDELKTLTKESFGFNEDLNRRERERIQARYREWWAGVGRVRFSRRP